MCEEIAVEHDLDQPPPEKAVKRRLIALKLLRSSKVKARGQQARARGKTGAPGKVDVLLLTDLYNKFKDEPDALNKITAQLPGGASAMQVGACLGLGGSGDCR